MGRWIGALFIALVLLCTLPAAARAKSFNVSGDTKDGKLEVIVDCGGSGGAVTACEFRLVFDPALMEFPGSPDVAGGYGVSSVEEGTLRTVFSSWENGSGLESISFEFRARKGTDISRAAVEVRIGSIITEEGPLPDVPPVSVGGNGKPLPSSQAELLTLKPGAGTLKPEFSPEVTEYRVSVPYEVTEMTFGMSASPGAKVSVNRKNLGSGGSTTSFRLTVTAEDGVTKQVYLVDVYRGAYIAPTPKPTPTPKPVVTPRPTATPKPKATPKPTATPKPAKTPRPTATPKPTAAPKKTPSPRPSNIPRPGNTAVPSGAPKPPGAVSSGPNLPLTEVVTVQSTRNATAKGLGEAVLIFFAAAGIAWLVIWLGHRGGKHRK